MSDKVKALIAKARPILLTPEEEQEQEIDFAYGNAHYENARITRELVANALPPLDSVCTTRMNPTR
jgi:hypothetical protein